MEEVVISLKDDEMSCDICGSKSKPVARQFIRDELRYIPSRLKIIRYCDRLFAIEDELKDMDPESRYTKRQELAVFRHS